MYYKIIVCSNGPVANHACLLSDRMRKEMHDNDRQSNDWLDVLR